MLRSRLALHDAGAGTLGSKNIWRAASCAPHFYRLLATSPSSSGMAAWALGGFCNSRCPFPPLFALPEAASSDPRSISTCPPSILGTSPLVSHCGKDFPCDVPDGQGWRVSGATRAGAPEPSVARRAWCYCSWGFDPTEPLARVQSRNGPNAGGRDVAPTEAAGLQVCPPRELSAGLWNVHLISHSFV